MFIVSGQIFILKSIMFYLYFPSFNSFSLLCVTLPLSFLFSLSNCFINLYIHNSQVTMQPCLFFSALNYLTNISNNTNHIKLFIYFLLTLFSISRNAIQKMATYTNKKSSNSATNSPNSSFKCITHFFIAGIKYSITHNLKEEKYNWLAVF